MGSFASKSSRAQRQVLYLAACILTSTALACASDDSDASETTGTAETEETQKRDAGTQDEAASANQTSTVTEKAPVGPEASPEAQAARDEAANPGSAAVTRYDGDWLGSTSQNKPVGFKILNRFVAHAEVSYALEGDGCSAEGEFKFSAMTPMRMGGFTLMNSTDTAKLVITGKFSADDASNGEYTVEAVGEPPAGCNASVSGTWTASK